MSFHEHYDFDLAVIGGGSGGYAAARTATSEGLKTAVIEGGAEVGGLCILRGCMPTKALLYAAEVLHLASHSSPWGIRAPDVSFNFAEVMARKDALIRDFAEYRQQQLAGGKFEFIRALARFEDPHTLALDNGKRLTARNFVIASGSTIAPSPLASLREAGYLTSDDALALKQLPKSLAVLGGGPVACEFAQFFARFGVAVTLIQRSPHILSATDPDAAAELENAFRREGITVLAGTRLIDARRLGTGREIVFEQAGETRRVQTDEILFALGRAPRISELSLEHAGLKTESGRIQTNLHMQTAAPHIFAAGDCTGSYEIVHIAIQQGETAAYNAAHPESMRSMDYRLTLEVVFTEPQVACVGLNERTAAARNIPFLAAKYPWSDHGKSLIMEAKDGFVKLLADPNSGEIIGGCCVGPSGGELIHEIVAAMAKRMTVQELAAMPHYHPTLAEIWTYPAEELAERIKGA